MSCQSDKLLQNSVDGPPYLWIMWLWYGHNKCLIRQQQRRHEKLNEIQIIWLALSFGVSVTKDGKLI